MTLELDEAIKHCEEVAEEKENLRGGINMAYVELQYKGKEPCCRCVHKKICEATRCLDEIRYTVRHLKYPLFNLKVECTEFYNEQQLASKVEGIDKESDSE